MAGGHTHPHQISARPELMAQGQAESDSFCFQNTTHDIATITHILNFFLYFSLKKQLTNPLLYNISYGYSKSIHTSRNAKKIKKFYKKHHNYFI